MIELPTFETKKEKIMEKTGKIRMVTQKDSINILEMAQIAKIR